jgi:hypothetical protein
MPLGVLGDVKQQPENVGRETRTSDLPFLEQLRLISRRHLRQRAIERAVQL